MKLVARDVGLKTVCTKKWQQQNATKSQTTEEQWKKLDLRNAGVTILPWFTPV